jgi:uncharacterized protein (DUF1800 family)
VAQTPRKRRKRKRKKPRCHAPRKRAHRKSNASSVEHAYETKRRRKCSRPKKKKKKARKPVPPPVVQPIPPPPPAPSAKPPITSPVAIYGGAFDVRQAERLLWRAGFGPTPGHAQALAGMGLGAAVQALTQPVGGETLTGAAPRTDDGDPLAPADASGHDMLWFLDRMVRTNQPLVERMTLIWHDWFATSNDGVGSQQKMLDQNALFRGRGLGSFHQLLLDVTADPAMILWLNQNQNTRSEPNENYAREVMELFTLGANRGAYTEDDVRELARALTGWDNDWSAELGDYNFHFDPDRHDSDPKTVFGKTGNYDWREAMQLLVEHPLHSSYFVQKLWSYFIPTPPSASDQRALEDYYRSKGYAIGPVVEAILMHPEFHTGPRMVKHPAVYIAGLLRSLRRSVDTESWVWLGKDAGQRLFYPPNVSGWDDSRWLDTSTVRGRWQIANEALAGRTIQGPAADSYDADEKPEVALASAQAFWSGPPLTAETNDSLLTFAASCLPALMADWEQHVYRALRQNALRQLIASSPDLQTC